MQSNLLKQIVSQKKIPIIGKGSAKDIEEKFKRLINENYNIIEITLRSNEALDVALKLKQKNPNITIGLGSINSLSELETVSKLGFEFFVSPGTNQRMMEFSKKNSISYIPGASTPSEILTAIELNFNLLKFFHAEQNGGVKTLQLLKEIFNDINFIPTGGINNENYDSYIKIKNVIAVGSTSF